MVGRRKVGQASYIYLCNWDYKPHLLISITKCIYTSTLSSAYLCIYTMYILSVWSVLYYCRGRGRLDKLIDLTWSCATPVSITSYNVYVQLLLMVDTKRQSVATNREDTMSSHSCVTRINRKSTQSLWRIAESVITCHM